MCQSKNIYSCSLSNNIDTKHRCNRYHTEKDRERERVILFMIFLVLKMEEVRYQFNPLRVGVKDYVRE